MLLPSHSLRYLKIHDAQVRISVTGKKDPIFLKRRRKEDLGDYTPMTFTSVPGRAMEQNLEETMARHMQD